MQIHPWHHYHYTRLKNLQCVIPMFHFHCQTAEHLPPAQSYSMVQVEDLKVKIRNAIRLVRSQESTAQCTRKCGERGKANVLIVTGSLVFKVPFFILKSCRGAAIFGKIYYSLTKLARWAPQSSPLFNYCKIKIWKVLPGATHTHTHTNTHTHTLK